MPSLKLLFSLIVIAADTYLLWPFLRADSLIAIAIVLLGLRQPPPSLMRSPKQERARTQLIVSYFLFWGVVGLIDTCRGMFWNELGAYIVTFFFFTAFLYLERLPDNYKYIKYYILFFIFFNLAFALLQMGGSDITAGSLYSLIPGIRVDRLFQGVTRQGLRISGAYAYCIGFASMLGCMFVVIFYLLRQGNRVRGYLLLALVGVMLFFTLTRSVLIALPTAVILADLIVSKKRNSRYLLRCCAILLLSLLVWSFLEKKSEESGSRYLEYRDGSSIQRYQVNIYGVVGTFLESPVFGTSRDRRTAMNAILRGYNELGLILQDYFVPAVTHHNEPAYYFRYYGFVGSIFYFLLYFSIIRYILICKQNSDLRKALLGAVLYFFIYNLMHNGKLLNSFFLWILLAINMPESPAAETAKEEPPPGGAEKK